MTSHLDVGLRPSAIIFLNGGLVRHAPSASLALRQPLHLLLNVAEGGNRGGSRGMDITTWPQHMEVDYVRVYQWPAK